LRLRWRFLFHWGDFWRATIAQKTTTTTFRAAVSNPAHNPMFSKI